jgi:hypothetical protein
MTTSHKQFQEVFEELYTLSTPDKILFLEDLLFYFTLTERGIWSDDKTTAAKKVEAFKWQNELAHRIWNIRFDLKRVEEKDAITRLYENMKFYSNQSESLRTHLVTTTLGAFENFKRRQ